MPSLRAVIRIGYGLRDLQSTFVPFVRKIRMQFFLGFQSELQKGEETFNVHA